MNYFKWIATKPISMIYNVLTLGILIVFIAEFDNLLIENSLFAVLLVGLIPVAAFIGSVVNSIILYKKRDL